MHAPRGMPSEKEIKQLVDGINKLKGAGSYRSLFNKYDEDGDGYINKSELKKLLAAADIGNRFTRGSWVDGVVEAADESLDTPDQKISWAEFQAMTKGKATAMVRVKLNRMLG